MSSAPLTNAYKGTHETRRINGFTIYDHAERMEVVARELRDALKELRSFYIEMTCLPPCAANAALAKAKEVLL